MLKKIKKLFEGGPVGFLGFVTLLLVILLGLSFLIDADNPPKHMSHSEFIQELSDGNIKKINVFNDVISGKTVKDEKFQATVHLNDSVWNQINEKKVDVIIASDKQNFDIWYLFWIGIFILLLAGIWAFVRRNKNNNNGGGSSSIFSFGKSRFKKITPGEIKISFADVAGATHAKSALKDIVEFLKYPEKFKKLGGRIPKGVLLAGEPGNGKTLIARALAGEAGCNFLSISGAEFVEVFVGVGAARIRDLFREARKSAPCILFVDEIDAIGRSRGSGFGGGHDEREQTLNQLLTEMDGFDQYVQPIVVIAATNIPEVLDKALMRPGRFDRIVHIPYPDLVARIDLFKIHTKKIPMSSDINFEELASMTQGLSGADIENLVNLASLKASQESRESISKIDFENAYKDVISSKKDMQMSTEKAKEFLPQQIKTKFKDVAGIEDAKEDMKEIVDFLKNPEKYKRMGARIPKGVLMSGDPGNGKTLLARAVAGEAGVPFFYAAGSQFIQKYVGVGAERIRELFKEARKSAPSIIFIDEIDSIGKKRDASGESGNSENDQTINQLLTEMDGFVQNEVPVIVIAATNIKDAIDSALKRPGRFDRHVHVPYPNLQARIKILNVHSIGKKFNEDVHIEKVAQGTPGFSGASLENLLNEAAILAVSHNQDIIFNKDIEEAKDRILLGRENKGQMQNADQLRKTAYHEAGHAILSAIQEDYPYAFHKVTILSRGGTLGVSFSLPMDDEVGFSKEQFEARIICSLGGRVAETIVYNLMHTGISSDFKNATYIAKNMVMVYGMGEKTGIVSYVEYKDYSMKTSELIDEEIKNILDRCYNKAYSILLENRDKLEILAEELMNKETVDAAFVYNLVGKDPKVMNLKVDPEKIV